MIAIGRRIEAIGYVLFAGISIEYIHRSERRMFLIK